MERTQTPKPLTPPTLSTVVLWVLSTIALFLMTALIAEAQIPDCCSQAIQYRDRYQQTRTLLDSTRAVGDRLLKAKDARISALEAEGNRRLGDRSKQVALLESKVVALTDTTGRQRVTIAKLEAENRKWVPQTWAGRQLRKVRDGLAVLGAVGIVVGTISVVR